MVFIIGSSLKLICNVLKTQAENDDIQNKDKIELEELLQTLNASERYLVAKYFCKLIWNIGSLKILSILQKLRILTATEYILSCEDIQEVQLIINDLLESEYDLITNLLINATLDSANSIRLNAILDESLENLFKDLLQKPELNDLSFLDYIKKSVTAEIRVKIIHKLFTSILGLQQTNIKEAFHNFSTWINEGVDDMKFPQDLYKQLLCEHPEESLNFLLKSSTIENFKEWKFYLIMLQTISSKNNVIAGPYIRKYLKLRLKQCATIPCKRSILHMLLTARAATANTMDITKNLNNYADWYKTNIGEMKFSLKAEEFQNILALLEQSINYEMEVDYLEIHTLIAISPPVLCGKLVQTYKNKCKQRLQQIKKGNLQVDAINASIVIEDSN
ncbi:uncharacterized protein LOC119608722 [Lucilia sericata]|uniref:uncharacterized protein LOC119608722 n=1 Tax=Lucilia sericata TaxID=13632 RepID=UPI0018A80E3C|nr:uncharacterized protein LOC119608722 [Lucilia sericata]